MVKKLSPEWWSGLRPDQVGKETEKLVKAFFDEMNQQQGFAYHRMPDAKAARGLISAQPGDYLYAYREGQDKWSGFVEAKATKHAFRLPKDKVSQLPVLKKFDMAGSENVVLVHHYMEQVWRAVPTSEMETGVPSWDLSPFPMYSTAAEALRSTGWFGS